jgi:4-amino-4-deoxy-L-arabinose transferase-like glycosyltransferase
MTAGLKECHMGLQTGTAKKKTENLALAFLILMGLIAAVFFKFYNLRESPGWYSDEGNYIDLAENWMQGKWQNYGITGAPYSQRPPLNMYITAAAMQVFGVDIGVTRGVSAASSLICVMLVTWLAWKRMGRREAILTLWISGVAPWVVMFGRFGMTYNLMAPFFLFTLISLIYYSEKQQTGWLIATAASSALAFATDYLGILCGITAGLFLLWKRPHSLLLFIPVFLVILAAVFIPVLVVNAPVFFADMIHLFLWGGQVQSSGSFLLSIIINYSELLRRESWILLGLCGLFLIQDKTTRNTLLITIGLTLLMVTRAYTPVGGGLHYLMHLFPIFALGLSIFILTAFDKVKEVLVKDLALLFARFPRTVSPGAALVAVLVVFTPIIWMVLSSFAMTVYSADYLFTGNDDLMLVKPDDADKARSYVNDNVKPGDLVLGSPTLIWGLSTMNRADFLGALAYTGQKPNNYIDVEKSRYSENISLDNARFVILDPLAEEFAPKVLPGMQHWLDEIHTWPMVFEAGTIRVYKK